MLKQFHFASFHYYENRIVVNLVQYRCIKICEEQWLKLCTCVCLNSRVSGIVHEMEQAWDNPIVKFLLENWSKIGRHLTQGVTTGEANSWMLK